MYILKGAISIIRTDKKGFTLIEVIVVLVILAILIALLAPSLTGYIQKAKDNALIAECRQGVIAGQTVMSEEYVTNPDDYSGGIPANLLEKIQMLSEAPGTIKAAAADTDHKLTHLVYENEGRFVTYCRNYDGGCSDHDLLYTIADYEIPAGNSPGGNEPPGGNDGGDDGGNTGGYDGTFTVDGVKFFALGELENVAGTNINNNIGIYYYNDEYFYLAQGEWVNTNLDDYFANHAENTRSPILINLDAKIANFNHDAPLVRGNIYMHNGEYYVFTPDSSQYTDGIYTWLTIETHPKWFYKLEVSP